MGLNRSLRLSLISHCIFPIYRAKFSLFDSHSLFMVAKHRKARALIITEITSPPEDQRAQLLTNRKLDDWDYRAACCPKPNMLAAALITSSGEFVLTYLNQSGSDIWAVNYHTERLDLDVDSESGYC